MTYNLKLKCKKCGHITEQNNLQRVEFVKPEFTMCPPHAWEDYIGEPVYDEIKNETSKMDALSCKQYLTTLIRNVYYVMRGRKVLYE